MAQLRQATINASEVDDYLDGSRDRNCDALEFWKVHCAKYSVLGKIARDIFGVELSSTKAVGEFSIADIVVRDIRNRLGPLAARASLCLRFWNKNSEFASFGKEVDVMDD